MRVEDEFTAYVRSRGDALLRIAWLVTRNHDDARDAVQDALLSLFRSRQRLPAPPDRDAYVNRSVVNACLRLIGRRTPGASLELESLPATGSDPADAATNAEAVWQLLAGLPPTQRAAIVLRFFADHDYADIACALDCREATARSHVHRALATLRTRMDGGTR